MVAQTCASYWLSGTFALSGPLSEPMSQDVDTQQLPFTFLHLHPLSIAFWLVA
jgi:hypothetical protein